MQLRSPDSLTYPPRAPLSTQGGLLPARSTMWQHTTSAFAYSDSHSVWSIIV
jgi:hypothetical protein